LGLFSALFFVEGPYENQTVTPFDVYAAEFSDKIVPVWQTWSNKTLDEVVEPKFHAKVEQQLRFQEFLSVSMKCL